MIGTIRKHSKWVWVVIIGATIVSFFYWGAGPGKTDRGRTAVDFGSIGGQRIAPDDYDNAQREAHLRFFFSSGGQWPEKAGRDAEADMERQTYFRLLLIKKQKELDIHVSDAAVAQVASQMLRSLNRGNPASLADFTKILQPQGLTSADFVRFIRHDLGIQQLIATAGLSGRLVMPQEARALYAREHEELSAEAVFFSASNYLAGVAAAPEAVAQFYTNRMADYHLPARVQVSYVAFGVSNYLAQAEEELTKTNLDELVEANYLQLGTNYFRDAKSPDEVKAKIREGLIRLRASTDARAKAKGFAGALFALEPARAENLEQLAKTNGLTVSVSAPFDLKAGPKDLKVGPDFAKAAFALTADEPFARPLPGDDAVYVIAFNQRLASEVPPLEKIRDQVAADYKFSQAVLQARQAGEAFFNALTNGLAQGKKFADICTETKARPVLVPPFSLSTRELPEVEDHASLTEFKRAAFGAAYGQPNRFVPTDEGGFVAFVQERLPLDQTKLKAELPAYLSYLRQRRENEAFDQWFRREAERGLANTPLAHPRPAAGSGAPRK